jgi:hypothetical protein
VCFSARSVFIPEHRQRIREQKNMAVFLIVFAVHQKQTRAKTVVS